MRPAIALLALALAGCAYLSPELRVEAEKDLSRFHRLAVFDFQAPSGRGRAMARELEARLKELRFDVVAMDQALSPGDRPDFEKLLRQTLADAAVLGSLEPREGSPGFARMTLVVLDAETGEEVLRRRSQGEGYASEAEAAKEAKAWLLEQMSLGDLGAGNDELP